MNETGEWLLRASGSRRPTRLPSEPHVLQAVLRGDWQPDDEVLGPGESLWLPIEDHPTFADALAELGPPIAVEKPDETRLDMNPLIDVALVLLIFFILTTSVASLRRALDMPDQAPDGQGISKTPKQKLEDRTIRVVLENDSTGKPIVKIDDKAVTLADVESELKAAMKRTDKREVFLQASDQVEWGIEARVHDAIRGAGITKIVVPKSKSSP